MAAPETQVANLHAQDEPATNGDLTAGDKNETTVMDEKTGQTASDAHAEQPAPAQQPAQKQEQGAQPEQKSNPAAGGQEEKKKDDSPEGGYSDRAIPNPPSGSVGYTLKITLHRAKNLAIGDMEVFSSDPYVMAQLNTGLEMRHKEDPYLRFRSFSKRRTLKPEWNEPWIVANVPSTGFKLKLRVYDEDPADHDDLLGKASVTVDSISDGWQGIKEESYKLNLAKSSKRAVAVRAIAACLRMVPRHVRGEITISIENLGRTGDDGQNGRAYTVGECRWFRHQSPVLGRLAHIKEPSDPTPSQPGPDGKHKKQIQHYNFQANQMQLQGPVPPQLYHRFVEFRPWVKRMFTTTGLQGMILGKALHHQHARVYNFDKSTVFGHFPQGPCDEMTRKFLELVHYDEGGRIYTYVLTLDALWRFTETGKEFGVDMLSKHTMHSDVSIYIAFSGEFFIRRLKHKHRPPPPAPTESTSQQDPPEHADNPTHPPQDVSDGPPADDPPKDPAYYELVIDNDSGTYRPNAKMLPQLADFLARSLPGLHIQTLDCQADADKMERMKNQQRERKKREGAGIVYAQDTDGRSSSVSSSDEEDLDRVQQGAVAEGSGSRGARRRGAREDFSTGTGADRERGTTKAVARDLKQRQAAKWDKARREYGRSSKDHDEDPPDAAEATKE